MSKCKITVDEGMDQATYFMKEPPTYTAVWVPAPAAVEEGEPSRLVFCVFTPTNGHNKGKLVQVPFHRIVSVASYE